MLRPITPLITLLLAALVLSGCSTNSYVRGKDAAPRGQVNVDHIRNPIPRAEPLAKSGNMPSYNVFGKTYYTLNSSTNFVERGIASWYGTKFHGRKTSSGEPYNMYAMTAAHKTLPLPTYVEVTNLENNRTIIVKVNDRGPFHEGRIIDLSYVAAIKLGIDKTGTGRVEIRAIDPRNPQAHRMAAAPTPAAEPELPGATPTIATIAEPEPMQAQPLPVATAPLPAAPINVPDTADDHVPGPTMYLQVGAFSSRINAENLRLRLISLSSAVHVNEGESAAKPVYRVRIGPLTTDAEALELVAQLPDYGISNHSIVVD